MDRRTFLAALTSACACPVCASLSPIGGAYAADGAHWSYQGHGGPAEWGKLAPEYAACSIGAEQSPIDLSMAGPRAVPAVLANPVPSWQPFPLQVANNGHTIQVNAAPGSHLVLDGETYALLQFHFHHPSEHTIEGAAWPMEVHFVHKGPAGLAVLGVMIAEGATHPLLETIWRVMPRQPGQATDASMIQAATLLPSDPTSWRYAGSLTTPPCSEVVSWVVFKQPITASRAQIDAFAALFPNNARPVQPLNRRKLLLDIL